jgi:16S rRNA (guanine527-N7)-methyltransferase
VAKPAKRPEAPAPLTPEGFAQEVHVSRETLTRLQIYAGLLRKWQPTINLVSRDSLADLWRRHFLDSAQLAELIPADLIPAGRPLTILDMGSGAGFPGLVLAILGMEGRSWLVHLVESDSRKAAFLATVARETGAPVQIHNKRLEDLAPIRADIVTARALAPLDKLVDYAMPFLVPGGHGLFLKGVGAEDELTAAGKTWTMTVDRLPSRSGPTGVVLRVGEISRG